MNHRSPKIRQGVLLATTISIFFGLFLSEEIFGQGLLILSFSLILGGIPHGAADLFLFKKAFKNNSRVGFILSYLLLLSAYGLLWWKSPFIAFCLFLLISFYHFGQSNWNYISFRSKLSELAVNILWGSLVVLFPIILHFEEASHIISQMIGVTPLLSDDLRRVLLFALPALNVWIPILLFEREIIKTKDFRREIVNVFILTSLFLTTPLLLGFAVYFFCWHSTSSVLDQVQYLGLGEGREGLIKFTKRLAPLTIGALVGLIVFFSMGGYWNNEALPIGQFFLFISMITLPHSILVDGIYQKKLESF